MNPMQIEDYCNWLKIFDPEIHEIYDFKNNFVPAMQELARFPAHQFIWLTATYSIRDKRKPEPAVDWSKVKPGTFVEVRDEDYEKWIPALFVTGDYSGSDGLMFMAIPIPIKEGEEFFRQCRLAPHAPSIMNWVENTGKRPPSGCLAILHFKNGEIELLKTDDGWNFDLNDYHPIARYAIIKVPE